MLKGKTPSSRGSTSGIDWESNRLKLPKAATRCSMALAMPRRSRKLRNLSQQHGVKAVYSVADMSKPADIRAGRERRA
jgi:hypothetical protein